MQKRDFDRDITLGVKLPGSPEQIAYGYVNPSQDFNRQQWDSLTAAKQAEYVAAKQRDFQCDYYIPNPAPTGR
jgi:hypothetical protein